METKNKALPARKMHKIVWVSVGVLILFFVTYPIAMWPVSQKEKFRIFHAKSLTIEGQNPAKVADANAAGKVLAESAIASSSALPAMFTESQKKLPENSPDVAPFTNKSSETAIASSATDQTV